MTASRLEQLYAERLGQLYAEHNSTRARKCSSCGALIFWTLTAARKVMPVDFGPNPKGNVVIELGEAPNGNRIWLSRVDNAAPRHRRRMSHFATCPAAAHRRKR